MKDREKRPESDVSVVSVYYIYYLHVIRERESEWSMMAGSYSIDIFLCRSGGQNGNGYVVCID